MPIFANLPDINLRGFPSSFNPMNFFNDQTPTPPTQQAQAELSSSNAAAAAAPAANTTSTQNVNETTPRAEAGPGPSTNRTLTRRNAPPPLEVTPSELAKGPSPMKSSLRPTRPTLGANSASSDSIDGLTGRRKSSGTSVVIFDTEVDKDKRGRKASVAGGDGTLEVKRKKKAAQDTYIIVKPPPTSSKNPLNLQVQLVVQTRRGRDRAPSSAAFSARSASMGSMVPSTTSSPAKATINLPGDVDSSSNSGNELTAVRSDSPSQISGDENLSAAAASRSTTPLGSELKRSNSLKSSVSATSNGSGAARSGTGGMGSGKRIEPMFNLAVHNVMQPTVVTDAATDTKVAKFHKRQVDISGVGVLEPSEVWLPIPGSAPLNQTSSGSDDGVSPAGRNSRPLSMVSFNTPLTPTMSRTSEFTPSKSNNKRGSIDIKSDIRNIRDSIISQTIGTNTPSPDTTSKKFFGKLFRKKDSSDAAGTTGSIKSAHRKSFSEMTEPLPSSPANQDALSPGMIHSGTRTSMVEYQQQPFMGHSTFGTAPSVVHRRSSDPIINPDGAVTGLTLPSSGPTLSLAASSSSERFDKGTPYPMVPSSRPIGYTWTVRKWAKRSTEGWAAHVVAASAAGLDAKMDDDVVFEWVKMKTSPEAALRRETTRNTLASQKSRLQVGSRANSIVGTIDSPAASQSSLALPTPVRSASFIPPSPNLSADVARPLAARSMSARSSPTRPSSMMEDTASTIHTQTEDEGEGGYDSDPEDSETPWTCSIWVKKTNQRQLLATLTPAPHHPKVIGQLKVPIGLRAIPLCQVTVRPTATALTDEKMQRQKESEKRIREEVCIPEEGLKDIICVSAMWLVAREEWGGLGRTGRTGRKKKA